MYALTETTTKKSFICSINMLLSDILRPKSDENMTVV